MGHGNNSKIDQALLTLIERDLFRSGAVVQGDLLEIERLARQAAYAGLLTPDEASEVGASLGRLRDALGAIHRALAFIRDSRPREIIVVEIADIGLLTIIPARADSIWLNGVLRRFQSEHGRQARRLLVQEAGAIPGGLRTAIDMAGLTVSEDNSIQPGYARLAV